MSADTYCPDCGEPVACLDCRACVECDSDSCLCGWSE